VLRQRIIEKSKARTQATDKPSGIRLTFPGTRGTIDSSSRRHRRHTNTLVGHRPTRVMIDCGAGSLGRVRIVMPTAIVITHGHSNHVDGLKTGAPCAV
jgi:phosphoribosyl 1,2-cyclic phosphodiesterase